MTNNSIKATMKMKLLAGLLFLATTTAAFAFPTSSNIIPTADLLEAGSMRTEWENDGAPRLFGQAAESYLLLEYAPHSRLEMGADLYSAGAANDLLFNAKWLLLAEKGRRPAVAAGFLELGSGYTATNYLVATKAVGQGLRMHFGFAAAGSGQTALFGAEQQVGEKDYLLLDYASWAAGYTSLGVYHDLSPGVGVNLAYAWPNADGESGLVLLNLSCTQARR